MKRLQQLFERKNILSIYFTAGYPGLHDTVTIIQELEAKGADLVEIGIPFSDPLADGPVIQQSSKAALENGMHLSLLFEQLKDIRLTVKIPLILMGYFNPVLQFGVEAFCRKCREAGIDGVIIPDLPLEEYLEQYEALFEKYGLSNVLLATPSTSEERLKKMDRHSNSFIYFVSANTTTGNQYTEPVCQQHSAKIGALKSPVLIGFGIRDKTCFAQASACSHGAVIGTSFIRAISQGKDLRTTIREFIQSIKN